MCARGLSEPLTTCHPGLDLDLRHSVEKGPHSQSSPQWHTEPMSTMSVTVELVASSKVSLNGIDVYHCVLHTDGRPARYLDEPSINLHLDEHEVCVSLSE